MNTDPIKCGDCGKFISYKDIENGLATHKMHNSWDSVNEDVMEIYESQCKKCIRSDRKSS